METGSEQGSDAHHAGAPSSPPKFAEVAPIVFSHLVSAAEDEADLAEACQALAATDVAGLYGRPCTARNTLVNDVWANLAAAADDMSGAASSEVLPSLYDALLRSGSNAPFRLLKKYLTVAGLRFHGSAPHDVLLAAVPPLVPPRLIQFARDARDSEVWRLRALDRRLEERGLAEPVTLPEASAIEYYASGRSEVYFDLDELVSFLAECAFLRCHADLDWRIKKSIVVGPDVLPAWPIDECVPPSEVARINRVDLSIVDLDYVLQMYEVASLEALADVVEVHGAAATARLPGLPPELAAGIEAAVVMCEGRRLMRRPAGDPEKEAMKREAAAAAAAVATAAAAAAAAAAEREAETEEARKAALIAEVRRLSMDQLQDEALLAAMAARHGLPPPALRYRCGHPACVQGRSRDQQDLVSREQFLDHWHAGHSDRGGGAPRPPIDARVLRCGHPSCANSNSKYAFEGLRSHARRLHKRDKGAPLALLDQAAAYR